MGYSVPSPGSGAGNLPCISLRSWLLSASGVGPPQHPTAPADPRPRDHSMSRLCRGGVGWEWRGDLDSCFHYRNELVIRPREDRQRECDKILLLLFRFQCHS